AQAMDLTADLLQLGGEEVELRHPRLQPGDLRDQGREAFQLGAEPLELLVQRLQRRGLMMEGGPKQPVQPATQRGHQPADSAGPGYLGLRKRMVAHPCPSCSVLACRFTPLPDSASGPASPPAPPGGTPRPTCRLPFAAARPPVPAPPPPGGPA